MIANTRILTAFFLLIARPFIIISIMSESDPGKVSVIVPARNEEANIERVVRSLAGQKGVREILVVDDQLEDRTAEIARGFEGGDSTRFASCASTLCRKAGWARTTRWRWGRARRQAIGCFSPMPTRSTCRAAWRRRWRLAEREGADLLSLSPGQITPTWWEKAVIPLVYVNLARLYKFEDVSDPASPAAAANGQYLLIRREVYERVGGHEAIRNQVLEDVELAKRVKATGGKLIFLPGAQLGPDAHVPHLR